MTSNQETIFARTARAMCTSQNSTGSALAPLDNSFFSVFLSSDVGLLVLHQGEKGLTFPAQQPQSAWLLAAAALSELGPFTAAGSSFDRGAHQKIK